MAATNRRQIRRWIVGIALGLVLLLGGAIAMVRVAFEGPDLGIRLADLLNKSMRGQIAIDSIEWQAPALVTGIRGGWVPVTIRGVKVWDDSTPRVLLLDTDKITAEIDPHAALLGNPDIVLRHIVVHGGSCLIEQTTEPYPLHDYDKNVVSLISAFYSRRKAGFRTGIYADKPPPIFDLRDVHLEHVDLTVHWTPYTYGEHDEKHAFSTVIEIEDLDVDPTVDAQGKPLQPRNDAFLYMDGSDPVVTRFYVSLAARGGASRLTITASGKPDYTLDFASVDIAHLRQIPRGWPIVTVANTLELDLSLHSVWGATFGLSGSLRNWWDRPYDGQWDLVAKADNIGPLLHNEINSSMSGAHATAELRLTGPFIVSPRIEWTVRGIEAEIYVKSLASGLPPLRLALDNTHGLIDITNDSGRIDNTRARVIGNTSSGELELEGSFGMSPFNLNMTVDFAKERPIDLGPWMPPSIAYGIGSLFSGHLRANGDPKDSIQFTDIDMGMARSPSTPGVRIFGGTVTATDRYAAIRIDALHMKAGATSIAMGGTLDNAREELDMNLDLDSPDLGNWLARLRAPALASSLRGAKLHVRGAMALPHIDVTGTISGTPTIGTARIVAHFFDGLVDIPSVVTSTFGGQTTGHTRMRIAAPTTTIIKDSQEVTTFTPTFEDLGITGRNLDARKVPGLAAIARGKLDDVDITGQGAIQPDASPFDWLDMVTVYIGTRELHLLGDAFSDVAVCINRKDVATKCRKAASAVAALATARCGMAGRRGSCTTVIATRDAGGVVELGLVTAPTGRKGGRRVDSITGVLAVAGLPLESLPMLRGAPGKPSTAGGRVSTVLRLGGDTSAPQVSGTIELMHAFAMGQYLGDSHLDVAPVVVDGAGALRITGTALTGRLAIDATIGTTAPYPVAVAVHVRRLELDPFFDVQTAFHLPEPVHAWLSGTISLRTNLGATQGAAGPDIWVELDELEASVEHRAPDGRPAPLRARALASAGPGRLVMSLHVNDDGIELACRDAKAIDGQRPCGALLATPAGVITLAGSAKTGVLAITADGTLDLALLAGLLDTYFDEVSGTAQLHAAIGGTLAAPTRELELRLDDIRLRPTGQETVVQVPTGLIKFHNDDLGLTDVHVRVDDEYNGEGTELVLKGGVRLDGFVPTKWSMIIEGQVAGKMLLAFRPDIFSQASGIASIEDFIRISGNGLQPMIDGTLVFDRRAPLVLIPRGVRRELSFSDGSIIVGTALGPSGRARYDVTLDQVTGSIDNEGALRNIRGDVLVDEGELASADITLDVDAIPFRIPGSLDLLISGNGIRMQLPSARAVWNFTGDIELVNGRYLRDVNLYDDFIRQAPPSRGPSTPFWEAYPAVGNAHLDLALDVRHFAIDNNIAKIELAGHLAISGTPRDPRLDGSIRAQSGKFRLPYSRADFSRTTGSLDFSPNGKLPGQTPTFRIQSEADYRAPNGQDHLITLSVTGTLDDAQWDLTTSTGYDKSQTLSLLLFGKTPDQLRQAIGDQAPGSDPTRIDPSTNPTTNVADEVVKDVAGDFLTLLVGNSLEDLTRLDVVRLSFGFASFQVEVQEQIYANARFIGDWETTVRGSTFNVRTELRTPTNLTLQGAYLSKNFDDEAEQDIQTFELKGVYHIFIP